MGAHQIFAPLSVTHSDYVEAEKDARRLSSGVMQEQGGSGAALHKASSVGSFARVSDLREDPSGQNITSLMCVAMDQRFPKVSSTVAARSPYGSSLGGRLDVAPADSARA
jgi:hypothetical protein